MSEKPTTPIVCLHDGGRHMDETWGGCLLATHKECAGPTCKDYKVPPQPETERHLSDKGDTESHT